MHWQESAKNPWRSGKHTCVQASANGMWVGTLVVAVYGNANDGSCPGYSAYQYDGACAHADGDDDNDYYDCCAAVFLRIGDTSGIIKLSASSECVEDGVRANGGAAMWLCMAIHYRKTTIE